MKKLLSCTVFTLLAFWVMAQQVITVSGNVTRISDGSPVANQFIYALADPSDSLSAFGYGFSNVDGSYSFDMEVTNAPATISVFTIDYCDSSEVSLVQNALVINNIALADFQICGGQPPVEECTVWTWNEYQGGLTTVFHADFYTLDGAQADTYLWDFGDGATSTEANPQHTYAAEGGYIATVTVTSETGCVATSTIYVWIYDDPSWSNCWGWADFTAVDSLTFSFNSYYYGIDSSNVAVSWQWDFGDGTTSTEANPIHTYAQSGFYSVNVSITGSNGCVAALNILVFTDAPPSPDCLGYIYYEQTDITSFNFSAYAWSPFGDSTGTAILSYYWEFGDSTISTDPNPLHTYAQEGVYTVQLHALTEDSCEIHACIVVFAYDCPVDTFWYGCQAMFGVGYPGWADPNNPAGGNPLAVEFYDFSLGAVQTWAWNFGDGATSNEANPAHTYNEEGIYTVTLSITTIDGCESTASYEIYVGSDFPWTPEFDCQALFVPLPDSIGSGSNGIQFIDLSYAPTQIQSWAWDFGDGTTSSEQNPYHVYSQAGTYTVSLMITADSCNSVISFDVDTENPWHFTNSPAQLGLSGSASTSIREPKAFDSVKLFPNPAQDVLNLAFTSKQSRAYQINLTDVSGRQVTTLQGEANNGANLVRVPVSELTPGFYMAQLRSGDSVETIKFVKN